MRSKAGNSCSSKYAGFQALPVTIVTLVSFHWQLLSNVWTVLLLLPPAEYVLNLMQ